MKKWHALANLPRGFTPGSNIWRLLLRQLQVPKSRWFPFNLNWWLFSEQGGPYPQQTNITMPVVQRWFRVRDSWRCLTAVFGWTHPSLVLISVSCHCRSLTCKLMLPSTFQQVRYRSIAQSQIGLFPAVVHMRGIWQNTSKKTIDVLFCLPLKGTVTG